MPFFYYICIMIRGVELHNIIANIFDNDVKGIYQNEQLQVNCPKCQEKAGLFSPDGKYNLEINTAKKKFKCWKCDDPKFFGNLDRLVKRYGGASYYELYKTYTGFNDIFEEEELNNINIDTYVELPKEYISFSNMNINDKNHLEAYNYMVLDRKLDQKLLYDYKIGFCVTGKYSGRIIVPSFDMNGNLNYFTGRSFQNRKPTYLNPKVNKEEIIFNEKKINWDSTIHLIEGVFDMFSLPKNSIPILGKKLGKKLFFKLKEKKPNIIIILDPDAYINALEIFEQLVTIYGEDSFKVKLVKLSDTMDIDEIRKYKGKQAIINTLYNAKYYDLEDVFLK
jgi:hypothetical protein